MLLLRLQGGSRATAGPQGSLFGYPEGQRVAYAAFEAAVLQEPAGDKSGCGQT